MRCYKTLWLKTWRQVGYVYDMPVSFQVRSICEYSLLGGGIQVLNHTGREVLCGLLHKYIGQGGKCVHDTMVTKVGIQSQGGLVK